MSEETVVVAPETKEVPLDQITDMREYKKAREEGKESVTKEVAPPEVKEEKNEQPEKPKNKGGFQARIDRLIKQQASTEERATAAEKRAQELESKLNGNSATKTEQPTNGEPVRENFLSDIEYYRALTRWEVKQEIKAEKEAEVKEQAAAVAKEAVTSYNQRMIALQADNPEYKELMSQDIKIPSIIESPIIYEMKNGPDVVLYLAKNPDICKEMLEMPPSKAVAEAWKISEKLAKEPAEEIEEDPDEEPEEEAKVEEEKPKRKAPAPIRPISGGSSRSTVSLDKTDFQAYKKLRSQGRVQ